MKGTKGRVNLFKNVFDVGFSVKGGNCSQSEILEKVHVLEMFVIYFSGWEVANVLEVRYDVR